MHFLCIDQMLSADLIYNIKCYAMPTEGAVLKTVKLLTWPIKLEEFKFLTKSMRIFEWNILVITVIFLFNILSNKTPPKVLYRTELGHKTWGAFDQYPFISIIFSKIFNWGTVHLDFGPPGHKSKQWWNVYRYGILFQQKIEND